MKQTPTYLFVRIPNLPALLSQRRLPMAQSRALAVVSATDDRGVVRSTTPQAERLGVREGQMVQDLRPLGDRIDLIAENPAERIATAQALTELLRQYSPDVRTRGEDAFIIDLTGLQRLWGESEEVARRLVGQISENWGLAASVGVGPTKTLAAVAAAMAGCPGAMRVHPAMVEEFMRTVPVSALPGVGPKTRERLERYGIHTAGDLREIPQQLLIDTFGPRRGLLLWKHARGQDGEKLEVQREVSRLRRETVLPEDTVSGAQIESFTAYLCGRLANDLQRKKLTARRLTVQVTYSDGLVQRINRNLPSATRLEVELSSVAREATRQLLSLRRVRIARIALSVNRLRPASTAQPALFDIRGFERHEQVADNVVRLRSRYGFDSVLSGRARAAVS